MVLQPARRPSESTGVCHPGSAFLQPPREQGVRRGDGRIPRVWGSHDPPFDAALGGSGPRDQGLSREVGTHSHSQPSIRCGALVRHLEWRSIVISRSGGRMVSDRDVATALRDLIDADPEHGMVLLTADRRVLYSNVAARGFLRDGTPRSEEALLPESLDRAAPGLRRPGPQPARTGLRRGQLPERPGSQGPGHPRGAPPRGRPLRRAAGPLRHALGGADRAPPAVPLRPHRP